MGQGIYRGGSRVPHQVILYSGAATQTLVAHLSCTTLRLALSLSIMMIKFDLKFDLERIQNKEKKSN